ncbi:S-adenosyl-L-methionine-dependent methyltransferase [Bisporella sp. PMI_857]|nr:S-adenosyl-L-methionine-dependent methyltransferase [Bisporella sp. PMI_857]
MTDTASLNSSIMKFREENGRRYHSFGSTEHWGPCDEDALDQQDISHHFWTLLLKGELYTAPVKNPQRILDVGCGTGIWVIDVAEKHPEADVKGVDVAPIQPSWVPPNARFELDDFNLLDWGNENKYDLIHQRELLGSVTDWNTFYRNCFQSLKPGGWLDCLEPGAFFESNFGTVGPDHVFKRWGEVMLESGKASGMDFHVGPFMKQRIEDAGFINVQEKKICCTIGAWSNDPWEREVGQWEQLRLARGVQLFCERRCINYLHWQPEEVLVFGVQMRDAMNNKRLKAHHWFYSVIAQKPPLTNTQAS